MKIELDTFIYIEKKPINGQLKSLVKICLGKDLSEMELFAFSSHQTPDVDKSMAFYGLLAEIIIP